MMGDNITENGHLTIVFWRKYLGTCQKKKAFQCQNTPVWEKQVHKLNITGLYFLISTNFMHIKQQKQVLRWKNRLVAKQNA